MGTNFGLSPLAMQTELIEPFLSFMGSGGLVLWIIFLLNVALWSFLLERSWYFFKIHPHVIGQTVTAWFRRTDHVSWYANSIRQMMIAEVHSKLIKHLVVIHTLISILPILGLLGTIIGMIEAFEVISVFGTGNARALASSISKALITTLAGLVASIPGLFFYTLLQHRVNYEKQVIADQLYVNPARAKL